MQKYKIAVSKDQKKYTLVLQADNESLAKERVHKEWYSILSIEEFTDNVNMWKAFVFSWTLKWEEKKWKVMWEDVFKVYIKLRKELGYRVNELYPNDDANTTTQEQKDKLLHSLEQEYEIFQEAENKKIKKEDKKPKKDEGNKKLEETNIDSFYMKKELEQNYKLIDFVLIKVQNLIDNKEITNLDIEQKEKLKTVYNSIVKIKKTTNVHKLKEIWEIALLKVWLLELHELDKNKSKQMKWMLKDTNKLLKQIWSSTQFTEKSSDYKKIFWDKFQLFLERFSKNKKISTKKVVDKSSHEYIRTELLIRKYKEKKKENDMSIIKNIWKIITDTEYRSDLLLRRKVINQNLLLYKVKQKWVNYSYTNIKKWYASLLEKVEALIQLVRQYLFWIIFFYSTFILIYINIFPLIQSDLQEINFNFKWLFYFILFIFVYLTLYIRKWFISLWVNFVILFFIIIFWIINF